MHEHKRLALAEDCAQDALQTVLAHLADFRGNSKFTTWAFKFGINISQTHAQKERWKHISLEALTDVEDPFEWLQSKDNSQTGYPEMPSLKTEVSAVIQEVVRYELNDRQRQVMKWMAFESVPMDVVVERLGTNRNAVYKLLHDARLKIKRQLLAGGYEVEEVYDLFWMV